MKWEDDELYRYYTQGQINLEHVNLVWSYRPILSDIERSTPPTSENGWAARKQENRERGSQARGPSLERTYLDLVSLSLWLLKCQDVNKLVGTVGPLTETAWLVPVLVTVT